ncbi:hypothetical protein C8J57DRAFT_1619543 [Mycena rebaudengoi]|nr:hypothetical protein C8J57DRAFT_1619543 [Mycena rebaudengoi]
MHTFFYEAFHSWTLQTTLLPWNREIPPGRESPNIWKSGSFPPPQAELKNLAGSSQHICPEMEAPTPKQGSFSPQNPVFCTSRSLCVQGWDGWIAAGQHIQIPVLNVPPSPTGYKSILGIYCGPWRIPPRSGAYGTLDSHHFQPMCARVCDPHLTLICSHLRNPALRPSVISGLAFPRSYCEVEQQEESKEETEEDKENLQHLPDTSILFKGYVRAGKTMNVYDWFDHFWHVAEAQPYTALSTGKGKGKARKPKKAEADDDDEMWKLSVQARFMRALHELDYLGSPGGIDFEDCIGRGCGTIEFVGPSDFMLTPITMT